MRSTFTVFMGLLVVVACSEATLAAERTLTAFIVRHADVLRQSGKSTASRDVVLSEAGKARAGHLARMLEDAEIEHIHSTDFKRTRATVAPSAAAFDIKVGLYNPRDVQGLVDRLRRGKGRHLVVGHTTTIPKMIELLGGDAGFPIDKAREFNRLYIVTVGPDGAVSTVLMRYGAQ